MAGSKLTPDVVDKLLDKLGTDDTFRSKFSGDPKAALQTLGAPADVECGACMSPKALAPKDHFQQSRQRFRTAMLSDVSQQVFSLEAKS